jgi:hypothetical protein
VSRAGRWGEGRARLFARQGAENVSACISAGLLHQRGGDRGIACGKVFIDPVWLPEYGISATAHRICIFPRLWERAYLPRVVWDPFAGDGAITNLMEQFGYLTHASDIEDYGLEGCRIVDYRVALVPEGVEAIVSNPPFAWALEFLERALSQVPYVAFLLRTHFLIEGSGRDRFSKSTR